MAGYSHKTWSCPFFVWDERFAVHCEGGRLRFPDREAINEYADRFCAGDMGWKNCTVARNLLLFYERAGEEDEE